MSVLRSVARRLVLGREHGVRRTLWRTLTGSFDPDEVLRAAQPEPPSDADGEDDLEGFTAILDESALAPGQVTEALLDGVPVAVCRTVDGYHVLDNSCPHAGGPLGDGDLDGHELSCPFHGWAFDVRTGRTEVDPDLCAPVHEVIVRDGRVWARA